MKKHLLLLALLFAVLSGYAQDFTINKNKVGAPISGAPNRMLSDKLYEAVSIVDAGAKANDPVTDTLGVQRALAMVSGAYVPPGRYILTSPIRVNGDFVLYGPPGGADRNSKNESSPNPNGPVFVYLGPDTDSCVFCVNAQSAHKVFASEFSVLVSPTFQGDPIKIKPPKWYSGVEEVPQITVQKIGFYRTVGGGITSGQSKSDAINIDLTDPTDPRALFGAVFDGLYAYNFGSVVKITAVNDPDGVGNWANGNTFRDIHAFQTFRLFDWKAGTDGVSTISQNHVSGCTIQPGGDGSGNQANGIIRFQGEVKQNTFVSVTPFDVTGPGVGWKHTGFVTSNPANANTYISCPGVQSITGIPKTVLNADYVEVANLNLNAGQLRLNGSTASADPFTIDGHQKRGTFTPSLRFGGGNTGLTYYAQVGRYTRVGDQMHFIINLTVNQRGSSTGSVTLEGLPKRIHGDESDVYLPLTFINSSSTLHSPSGELQGGDNKLLLKKAGGAGDTGYATMTHADIGDGTTIRIRGSYTCIVE